ncbi:SDR family NAD(P)-dependent oxidoreductase [Sinomicrobium pectinilyticum]|uniref:SDR family NAD(P)-dependent oxidoreductase n=1 Tax=Sinomicrobium pectinilyticum TaxID=1084421 RepID=A0A3N0E9D1_SINP1|nr:type I polyketide synthase [Sinomicrobium pectinilyticum]RNL84475.1 SDR family NAD(P)-dependent oxidoreductase [Sinomicrobium pectinilyticum]
MKKKKIAIVGIGCRYAGNITDSESFWHLLKNCHDGLSSVPEDRWSLDKFYDPNEDAPGKMYVKRGAFLKGNIYDFDYNFFGLSRRESLTLDIQQKLLLEIAYEAFDDAGLDIHALRKTNTGVFIGAFMLDNLMLRVAGDALQYMNTHTAVAGSATLLSNRLSHAFDLMGPSVTIDTACSSSMVAIHLACQAIKNGEAELAIAGGVNVMLSPAASVFMCKGKYLARDGRSKAFSEQADGYGRGEGAGILVLKSLDKAIADNDDLYAVIEGTAINQDGRTEGISLPNLDAQVKVIRSVLKTSSIHPSEIDYVEAHGTGTKAGDPIELNALGSIYGKSRSQPLPVGSIKPNIGHTEAASGVAGVIKAALVLKKQKLVPHMHLGSLSPAIPFSQLNISVPLEGATWYLDHKPAYAAVNSFGYGGTNGHAILSGYHPDATTPVKVPEHPALYQFPISGNSSGALKGNAVNLLGFLEKEKDLSLHNLAYTLTRRKTLHHLVWLIEAASREELIAALEMKIQNGEYPRIAANKDQRLVWVFTGMGPQWYGMGQELYRNDIVFRNTLNKCDAIFTDIAGYSLLTEMQKGAADSQITRNNFAQAANFFIQVGLSEMLTAKGISKDMIIGHSVGEIAAAVIAKTITLEEGVRIIYHRGDILEKIAGKGTLLAVGLSSEKAAGYLQSFPGLEIATINSPQSVTIAGTEESLGRLDRQLTVDGFFSKFVRVEVAYHSSQTDILEKELLEAFDFVEPHLPATPLYSTVTGTAVDTPMHHAGYWWRNIRQQVFFNQTLENLIKQGYTNFIEIGPHPVLGGAIKEIAAAANTKVNTFHTLKRHTDESENICTNIEEMMSTGVPVLLNPGIKGEIIRLPAYAWDKEYCWAQAAEITSFRSGENNPNPFLQEKIAGPALCWKTQINRPALHYLKDHQIGNTVVFPGAGYVESILSVLSASSSGRTLIAEQVEFNTPLSFQESEYPELFTSLFPEGNFSISSKVDDNWTTHVKGMAWTSDKYTTLPGKDIQPLLATPRTFTKADAYQYFALIGLNYKEHFQTISSYSFFNNSHVFAILQRTGEPTSRQSVVHPEILDGAFQSILLLLANTRPGQAYLPVKIDTMKVFKPLPPVVYCIGEITRQNANSFSGNLQLLDGSGNVLVDLQGLFCKKTTISAALNPQQSWIYKYTFSAYEFASNHGYAHTTFLATGDRSAFDKLPQLSTRPIQFIPIDELVQIKDEDFQLLYIAAADSNNITGALADCHQLITLLQSPLKKQLERLLLLIEHGLADETSPTIEKINPHHTALAGFARTVTTEMPHIQLKTIDLQHSPTESDLSMLVESIFEEEELIYTASGWYQGALIRDDIGFPQRAQTPIKNENSQPYRLDILQKGKMESLAFRNIGINAPDVNEVQIEVASSSINFKDVMKAMGMLNEAALEDTFFGADFGLEGAGIVTQVHPSVEQLKVGDRVYFIGNGLRTHININRQYVFKLPDNVSFREAASFFVYYTAWTALIEMGRLQKDERILIHAAAGGVGLSACNIALARGAEVYATAGTNEKRALLKAMGVVHVYDSRSLNFYDEILQDTNGEGVDVVLNSLSGPALHKSLRLIRTLGRFIEIGKQDITTNSKLSLLPFNKSVQFIALDLDKVLPVSPQSARRFFLNFLRDYTGKLLAPLPYEVFDVAKCKEAFKKLASGTHSGKVVIDFTNHNMETVPETRKQLSFNENESILITGGCGGFGLRTAQWLAEQGVKHLVLGSRSGRITSEEGYIREKIETYGCTVYPVQLDVTDPASVKKAVQQSSDKGLELAGIIHAAAVMEDCLIESITPALFDKVFLPKALGAWHLHKQTRNLRLKFFVCYSSVTGYTGNTGQLAYTAANCFLDGLALDRIRHGLPATSISWGAISETGMLARNQLAQSHVASIGYNPISPVIGLQLMGEAIDHFQNHIGIIDIDWNKMTSSLPGTWKRLSRLLENKQHGSLPVFISSLLALERDQWDNVVVDSIKQLIAEITGSPVEALQMDVKLSDLGFDSIMSVELVVAIQSRLGIDLPVMEILGAGTITQLAQLINTKIYRLKTGSQDKKRKSEKVQEIMM